MYSIKRLFNRNIRNIIIVIIVIAFIIGMIQLLNYISKEKSKDNKYIASTPNINKQSYAVLSKDNINQSTTKENTNLVNEFVEYCNVGKVEEAYNLISEECKSIYYSNIEGFREYYYNQIFNEPREADIQAWSTGNSGITYKVEFLSDILSSGKYNTDAYIEDYITVVSSENDKKININGFISVVNINKFVENSNIKINCIKKEIYTEYEIYEFDILNNSDNILKLDSGRSNQTVYLLGENDVKYTAFMHEVSEYDLTIEPNKAKKVKIKFNKFYNTDIEIKNIIFEDIILNYQKADQLEETYKNRESISISIK